MPENVKQHVSPEQVLAVLETCYDPCCKERSVNIVELGLIQGVKVAENGQDVQVELLLTSGWCPFSTHLLEMIDQSLHRIEGVGEVESQRVASPRRDMGVHVPQTGDQKLAGAVHGFGVGRNQRIGVLAHGNDPAILDDDRLVRLSRRSGGIDNRDVSNRQRRGVGFCLGPGRA